jgi:LytTr DNA-binding domain
MTEIPIHEAPVVVSFRQYLIGMGVATSAAVFMAVTGALGTGEAGFGIRTVFWLIVMLAGWMIGSGVSTVVKVWGGLARWRLAEVAAISLLMALPQTLVVIAARSMVFDLQIPSRSGIVWMFGFVLFICVIMVAIDFAMHGDKRAAVAAPAARPVELRSESDPLERFRERLPQGLRSATLLALEAEDHYLRVHTDLGSDLILLRLGDAIAELDEIDGAQTHRSWWVSRAALASVRRGDGRATLTLSNGLEVPVSRSFYKPIVEAGWLR